MLTNVPVQPLLISSVNHFIPPNLFYFEKFKPFQYFIGGHAEVVSVLLEAKANPNIRGIYNATPLHAAVKGNATLIKSTAISEVKDLQS